MVAIYIVSVRTSSLLPRSNYLNIRLYKTTSAISNTSRNK